MSKTLFWYVMRDLLRIFLMTSAVFAGIMSFGGLLKQMMQYGMSGWQVGQMLMYLMPAMQTYSLPISALFATTMVYGRLASDNELVACRATGISHFALAMPALVLGLILATGSLALLSFVVPHYTLKAEKVVFTSLGEVVQNNIQRSHQIRLMGTGNVIYAESAEALPPDPESPDEEVVYLENPIFCSRKKVEKAEQRRADAKRETEESEDLKTVPSVFYIAKSAKVWLRQVDDRVEYRAVLEGGLKVPREAGESDAAGFRVARFGPVVLPSPIKEQPKFMKIDQLKALYREPVKSRDVGFLYKQITCAEQETQFLTQMYDELRNPRRHFHSLPESDGATYILKVDQMPDRARPLNSRIRIGVGGEKRAVHLVRQEKARDARSATLKIAREGEEIELVLADVQQRGAGGRSSSPVSISIPTPGKRAAELLGEVFARLEKDRTYSFAMENDVYVLSLDGAAWLEGGETEFSVRSRAGRQVHLLHEDSYDARAIVVEAQADPERKIIRLEFEMTDMKRGRIEQAKYLMPYAVPMAEPLKDISLRGVDYYSKSPLPLAVKLREKTRNLESNISAEMHGRAAFAISCLILVAIGCSLGMMFKTGNYLSAFALSAIPALLCIALIVTGQHVVENDARNLTLGLALVWSGDAIVFVLGSGLMLWLHRQ